MVRTIPIWGRVAVVLFGLVAACGGAKPAANTPATPSDAKVTSTPEVKPIAADASGEEDAPIPIANDDPTWGSRQALVTIVEFTDLQCPFCSRAQKTMNRVREKYGPTDLRVVWKHLPLPFHVNARPAAEWAQGVFATAGSDAFGCFVQKAFDDQAHLSPESYAAWASACGANASAVAAGVGAHTWKDKITRDGKVAAKLEADGTPTFFINGVEIVGAQPFEKFTSVVDDQISIANQILEKGAPRDKLYVIASTVMRQAMKEAKDEPEEKEDTTTVFKIPIGQSAQRGPATAPVTIVEFSDFQCPFCKRAEETITQLRTKYGDRVRFVWKDEPLPFHARAEPAAELAREARAERGDLGFWDAHDKLFAASGLEDNDLVDVAKALKLDAAKAQSAIATHRYRKLIDADLDLADDFQANGTPHFFINGRRLVGAQPLDKFSTIIDDELKHAESARARGVAAAKIYDELTKDGKTPPPPEKKTVGAAPNAPVRGAANAPVTIQEFADFQCPFCERVEDTLKTVLKEYPGRVKIVWRDLPLPMHENANLAAQAAAEAYAQKGNDGFWKMHDLLYAHQKDDGLKRDALDGYARQVGLDMTKWAAALDNGTHKAAIDKDGKAATDANISGTPSFVVNGYFVSGAQPLPRFRKVIDLALSDAAKH